MSTRYDLADPESREAGLAAAVTAVRRGQLVVLPTDTVYGLGVDAFDADGGAAAARRQGPRPRHAAAGADLAPAPRSRRSPPSCPGWASGLVEKYWPGPLTIVCRQQPSLRWDLGETRGTVAIRMPDDEAPSSCSAAPARWPSPRPTPPGTRRPPTPTTRSDMLGWAVEVVLDGGPSTGPAASTIVDCTGTGRASCARARSARELDARSRLEQLGRRPARAGVDDDPLPTQGADGARTVREYLLVFLVAGVVSYLLCVFARELAIRVGRRRPGARPRRPRDADPVLRRRRDARRPRRRAAGRPPPAVPEHLPARSSSTTPASC